MADLGWVFRFLVLNRATTVRAVQSTKNITVKSFHGSLEKAAKDIMLISKSQYVPIDTGALMASGRVVKKGDRVEMMYGGPPHYAVWVHEINKNYRNGRQWKYLETPARKFNFRVEMTTEMRRQMAGRIGGLTAAANRRAGL